MQQLYERGCCGFVYPNKIAQLLEEFAERVRTVVALLEPPLGCKEDSVL
jgi:hypothetical protein